MKGSEFIPVFFPLNGCLEHWFRSKLRPGEDYLECKSRSE